MLSRLDQEKPCVLEQIVNKCDNDCVVAYLNLLRQISNNIKATPITTNDLLCIEQPYTYYIRTNIGEELNLVNWQTATRLPNLNFANILIVYITIFQYFYGSVISPN